MHKGGVIIAIAVTGPNDALFLMWTYLALLIYYFLDPQSVFCRSSSVIF